VLCASAELNPHTTRPITAPAANHDFMMRYPTIRVTTDRRIIICADDF
jgi:hypothetical protein